jgi:ATP-dependent protease ClpP protease subunit
MTSTHLKPNKRTLYIVGEIDEKSYLQFSKDLAALEAKSAAPVVVELNSPGGSVLDSLAFSGRMRTSPCDIEIRAFGFVASAAVLLLASGDNRIMTKDSWMMVHQGRSANVGELWEQKRDIKVGQRMEDQWSTILQDLTGTSKETWDKLHLRTTYLTADQCLKLKIVDKVV